MARVKDWWMDQQDQAFEQFETGEITEAELIDKLKDLNAYDEETFLDYLFTINYEGTHNA